MPKKHFFNLCYFVYLVHLPLFISSYVLDTSQQSLYAGPTLNALCCFYTQSPLGYSITNYFQRTSIHSTQCKLQKPGVSHHQHVLQMLETKNNPQNFIL